MAFLQWLRMAAFFSVLWFTLGGGAVAAEFCPIVDQGVLLGASLGDRWLNAAETAPRLKGGESYGLYILTRGVGRGQGSKPKSGEAPAPQFSVDISPPPKNPAPFVAVGCNWNALPRSPKLVVGNLQIYEEGAAEILKSKGIVNPRVRLTRVILVDVDGDGVLEALVSATHYAEGLGPGAKVSSGDYSMVFLQRFIKAEVYQILLEGVFHPEAAPGPRAVEFQVGGVLDLNGDGAMEVVVRHRSYQGRGASVYCIYGIEVKKVLTAAWGS